jgi:hypothetical protein
MNTALFIAMCVLALLNIILYTFVSAAIHKRDLCQASPYYHCDTSWQCCTKDNPNCDSTNSGPQNGVNAFSIAKHYYGQNTTASVGGTGINGMGFLTCKAPQSAAPSSKPYYEACIQPIQVIMKNYDGSKGAPNFDCVYSATVPGSSTTAATCTTSGGLDLETTYLSDSSGYGVKGFIAGQCCYQKFDPDQSTNAPSPQVPSGVGNLYPNSASLTQWNSSTSLPPGSYNQPTDFRYPVGSNTNTQNNSCNNSMYSAIPGAPYTAASYKDCPPNTS